MLLQQAEPASLISSSQSFTQPQAAGDTKESVPSKIDREQASSLPRLERRTSVPLQRAKSKNAKVEAVDK
jgi:hypothetical protein